MSDRRIIQAGPIGNLPVVLLVKIWRDVSEAGRRARNTLRRYLMSASYAQYWQWEAEDTEWAFVHEGALTRLYNERRLHWQSLRLNWTPREERSWQRRHNRDMRHDTTEYWPLYVSYFR